MLDDIIIRLLEGRGRPGKLVELSETEIRQLCVTSRNIFLQQPNLLELESPIKICGKALICLFCCVRIDLVCFGFVREYRFSEDLSFSFLSDDF
ncbi:hypothetical protein CDL15_Pgr010510 [Punica granatum]|uniref:protein-serine/threonine phosphatase n=1 Tax=Punica granatum TaxID=22663 RepID=A0A218XW70_PUNGR|nr:hypothetical protein CDL15_Pgr010510 [Punica granatum]